jgi:hypothetical protein
MEEIREPMLEYKKEVQERTGKSIGIKKRSHLCSFIRFQKDFFGQRLAEL